MKVEYHKCDRCGETSDDQSRWRLVTYSDFEVQNVTLELCEECRESLIAFLDRRFISKSLFTDDPETPGASVPCTCGAGKSGPVVNANCPVHGWPMDTE